jgi:hypothetical protein
MTACTQNPSGTNSVQKIKEQAAAIAENFVKEKLKDPVKNVTNTGLIIYSSGDTKCLVDPSYFIIGQIDDDKTKDAIVTIYTMVGQGLPLKEHLILLNKKGKLSISKEYAGNMRFLKITDRTIYIETSHMSPDSPFAECGECKEIRKYKYVEGDTVRVL